MIRASLGRIDVMTRENIMLGILGFHTAHSLDPPAHPKNASWIPKYWKEFKQHTEEWFPDKSNHSPW